MISCLRLIMIAVLLPLAALPLPAAASQLAADLAEDFEVGVDRNDRMTVPVMINGKGPYPFVIDTGSERTMISSELAAELELKSAGTGMIHTISGEYEIDLFEIDVLNVTGDGVLGILAPAVSKSRLGAVGLLGLDSLKASQVLFDMRDDIMSVRPALIKEKKKKPTPRISADTIVVTAKSLHGRLIFTDAEVNGVPVRVVVDTGAEVTVGNQALRDALRRRQTAGDAVDLIGVVGDTMAADLSTLRNLQLHGMTISGGHLAYSDAPIFMELGLDDEPAILMGMGTIRAFREVAIDFANRQVSFVLHPSTNSPLKWNCGGSRIARNRC